MRRLALLVAACSGCIISAPEGAPQSWPPPLGVTVQAVTAGDLDGNGSTDIVVYSSGTDSQAGMYLLTGGKDLGSAAMPVKSFSKFVSTPLQAPTAAVLVPGAAPTIYVATAPQSSATVELTQYSNILTEKAHVSTAVPTGNATLWVRPILFPGNMQHIAVSNGGSIDHASPDFNDVKPIPPMGTPSWDVAQVATSYVSGMDSIAVVATASSIQRAALPTAMTGGMFTWANVRAGTTAWVGQTAFDLDGDGREEIIGLDLANHQVCVVDPGAATIPVTPTCLVIAMLPDTSEVTLLVGTNITMGSGPDMMIVSASPTDTQFTLVEDYTYTSSSLTAAMVHGIPVTGPAHGRTVIANSGPGTPNSVLVFGTDGTASCVLGPC